ncbi:MAG: protein phosphatase 2C domain-containing protein [Clostridium sp.]|nr:protein phosphatase 2C domain-containing protein [Clostridium sp.]MCM1547747.1 protein phosphatase 2C domain-containing protein [Ruminococcus sp.]
MYYCCGITDNGIMDHNEDAFLIEKTVSTSGDFNKMVSAPFIAAVSDGVSGEKCGEIASSKCLELLGEVEYSSKTNLKKEVINIHNKLKTLSAKDKSKENMQATLCAVAIDENDVINTVNVGDSRMYRYRRGDIKQISRDQSLVQLLYEEGTITEAEKKTHVHRNIIFPVMGNKSSKPKPDIKNFHDVMKYGDVILICSDGLSDYVTCTEMEYILELPENLTKRLKKLVKLAIEKGSKDNITIVALCCYE